MARAKQKCGRAGGSPSPAAGCAMGGLLADVPTDCLPMVRQLVKAGKVSVIRAKRINRAGGMPNYRVSGVMVAKFEKVVRGSNSLESAEQLVCLNLTDKHWWRSLLRDPVVAYVETEELSPRNQPRLGTTRKIWKSYPKLAKARRAGR